MYVNKVKKIVSILVTSLFVFSASGCIAKTEAGKENTVVAKVGEEKIRLIDVKKQMKSNEDLIKQQYGDLTSQDAKKALESSYVNMLERVAEWKLLNIVAKENYESIIPNLDNIEAEVEKQVNITKEMYFDNDDTKFKEGLESMGYTLDSLKDSYREDIRYSTDLVIAGRVEYEVTKNITVSEEEIKSYYTTNVASYTTNPGAKLYHIVVDTEENAKEIRKKLKKDAKFEDLAKEHNKDGSENYGGLLGYIEYDSTSFDEAFMKVAKELHGGQISQPVKTANGWEIIKAEDVVKDTKVTPVEEVKDSIKERLLANKRSSEFATKLAKWKEEKGFKLYESKLKKNIF